MRINHRRLQIGLFNWVLLPLIAIKAVSQMGVSLSNSILGGIIWLCVILLQKLTTAWGEPKSPEAPKANEQEVEGADDGRRINFYSKFVLNAPEGYRFYKVDDDTLRVESELSGKYELLEIRMQDARRVNSKVHQALLRLLPEERKVEMLKRKEESRLRREEIERENEKIKKKENINDIS